MKHAYHFSMKLLKYPFLSALVVLLMGFPISSRASFSVTSKDLDGGVGMILAIIAIIVVVMIAAAAFVTVVAPFVFAFMRLRFLRDQNGSISSSRWLRVGCLAAGTPALWYVTYSLRAARYDPSAVSFSNPFFVIPCGLVVISALTGLVPDAWMVRLLKKGKKVAD